MKRVLMVIPFGQIYPPMNGGMLRCFNLLNQLCRHFDVTAIMHQDTASFMQAVTAFPDIKKCKVVSTTDNNEVWSFFSLLPNKYANALKYRYWNRSVFGPAGGNFMKLYPPMKAFLKKNKIDYVILEDMEIIQLAKLVKRYHPYVPVFYDAYNVNTTLAGASLAKGEISTQLFELIKRGESAIFKHTDKIFACSESDLLELRRMNQGKISGTVIPNGVVMPHAGSGAHAIPRITSPDILFCGSMDYSPNREGLIWFLKNVFQLILDAVPAARLMVVGKGDPGEALTPLLNHPSIINYGMVERVDVYYQKAAVAIVPLLSGSGTRLKLLEAMAHKAPIVSTAIGAEGIEYTEGKNILIGDNAPAFAVGVTSLLNNASMATDMAASAFSFVQNTYDWNIIGEKMSAYLLSCKN